MLHPVRARLTVREQDDNVGVQRRSIEAEPDPHRARSGATKQCHSAGLLRIANDRSGNASPASRLGAVMSDGSKRHAGEVLAPPPARGRRPGRVAIAITLVGLLITAAVCWTASRSDRNNERRLLQVQTRQAGTAVGLAILGIESPLRTGCRRPGSPMEARCSSGGSCRRTPALAASSSRPRSGGRAAVPCNPLPRSGAPRHSRPPLPRLDALSGTRHAAARSS